MIWDSKSWCILGFKLAIFTLNPTLKKYFASQIWLFLFVLTSYFPKISILRWKINIMGFMGCKILGFMGCKCITYIRRLLLFYFFKYFIIIILLIFSFFILFYLSCFSNQDVLIHCFIFQCFTKTTSYVKFGMQICIWFWDSNWKIVENLGCKMIFMFVMQCSWIPFLMIILGCKMDSHWHICDLMFQFWDSNMVVTMGFKFISHFHMYVLMIWIWDAKSLLILGFKFDIQFAYVTNKFDMHFVYAETIWFWKWFCYCLN